MTCRTLLASLVGVVGLGALPAMAASTPIEIGYDIAHVGGYTSDPATPMYGWSYPHTGMGTAVVTSQSADLKTDSSNAEVGALYLDTSLNVHSPEVSLSFDLNVVSQAASGYGQTKSTPGGNVPILYGVRIFGGGDWAASFQLSPTSETMGQFGFRSADNNSFIELGTYDTNTLYHIKLDVDYANNLASASINGITSPTTVGLGGGANANATTNEIFTYLNGSLGSANEVQIAATTPLPRTAWMGLGVLGLFGAGRVVSRRKAAAM